MYSDKMKKTSKTFMTHGSSMMRRYTANYALIWHCFRSPHLVLVACTPAAP